MLGTSLNEGEASNGGSGGAEREQIAGVDILYLKNVLLKFLDAAAAGRTEQVSFPAAVGALLTECLALPVMHVCFGLVLGSHV